METCWNVSICHVMYYNKYIETLLPVFYVCCVYSMSIYCSNTRNAKTQIHSFKSWETMDLWDNDHLYIDTKVTCYLVDITSLLMFHNQWETSIYDSMKLLRFGSHSYVASKKTCTADFFANIARSIDEHAESKILMWCRSKIKFWNLT